MYQEDMMNEGDGCGGLPATPKVSVENINKPERKSSLTATHGPQPADNDAPLERPYNHSEFVSDQSMQRQYHQFTAYQPPLEEPDIHVSPRSRSGSRSPTKSRRPRSPGRSLSPSGHSRRNSDSMSSYHLMPKETEANPPQTPSHNKMPRRRSSSLLSRKKTKSRQEDLDEQYEAQVALVIQMAMTFFCVLIALAVVLSMGIAIFTHHGYWVVILLCLTILVSFVLGLGCLLYQVLNEDDAPRVNQEHMPKWYRTLRKIIKDELDDFREDWLAMRNNMYLLEDGIATTSEQKTEGEDLETSHQDADNQQNKPKKRRGKSALFKMVAKPAALLANFRRKRRGRRRQRKGQTAVDESMASIPSVV